MKLILFLILSLVLVSCSSSLGGRKKNKVKRRKRQYSKTTEDQFSRIEKNENQALSYYQRLRWNNWNKYKKATRTKQRNIRKRPTRSYSRPVKKMGPPPAPRKHVAKRSYSPDKSKELYIEIKQNMSFYCMEKRKSRKFSNSQDCNAYTQNALSQCEDAHPVISDRSLYRCVKRKLK
jgi:hypothetical protein